MANKNVTMRRQIDGVMYDLMLQTTSAQVYDEATNKTVAVLLSDILIDIGTKASNEELQTLKTKFDNLVLNAPEAYDTLIEIGSYIATHQDEYTALLSLVSGKVNAEVGKGLSTNDFTNELKSKLSLLYGKDELDTKLKDINDRIDLIQSGGTDISAENVKYENISMKVTNVKEALDKMNTSISNLKYSTYTAIDANSGYLDLL